MGEAVEQSLEAEMSKGMSKEKTKPLPIEDEDIATFQEAIPVPYFAGKRKIAVRWIDAATNRITKRKKTSGGGFLGNLFGGDQPKTYNYFGTVMGVIGIGPIDVLHSMVTDGEAIWEGTQNRGGDKSVDLTGSIDPKQFTADGWLKVYYGTGDNDFDMDFTTHPDYSGIAAVAAKNLFFGLEKQTAPNIEVWASRKPVCDTSLCAAIKNTLDDGHVNTVAVIAELLTNKAALGMDLDRLDADSWAAAAEWCYDNRTLRYCAPLITSVLDAREAIAGLLSLLGGALAWTADGKLALKLFKWGVDPGGLTTLDAQYFTSAPRLSTGGWSNIPTGIIVRYADRDRKFKTADVKLDNLIARRVRGEHQRRTMDCTTLFTRREQAEAVAAEAIKQMLHPQSTMSVTLRREHGVAYRAGDKVKVDVDPEPGGGGLAHLAIVEDRSDDGKEIKLTLKLDPIADSTPYTPTFTPPDPQDASVDSIQYALILPLNNIDGPGFHVLAARPQDDCTKFRVYFDTDSGGDFADLGEQTGFAVRMTLDADVDEEETVLRLTLTDGATGRDAYLAERTAGDEITAATDKLLLILANVDVDGRVIEDANGLPELEFLSVVSRAAVDSDTHDYTVFRARRGLDARPWVAADCVAWIIPGTDLVTWRHSALTGLLITGDPGYVQLAAATDYTEDESSPLPDFSFTFPDAFDLFPAIVWDTPASSPYTLDVSGQLTPEATITDPEGKLVRVELYSINEAGANTVWLDILFPPAGEVLLSELMTAAGVSTPLDFGTQTADDQQFTLWLRVHDITGNVVEDSRTLLLEGSASSGLGAVTFDPPGGRYFEAEGHQAILVEMSAPVAADEIHYAIKSYGSSAPTSHTVGANPVTVAFHGSKRLWARASDGVENTPWQYQDYEVVAGGGGED